MSGHQEKKAIDTANEVFTARARFSSSSSKGRRPSYKTKAKPRRKLSFDDSGFKSPAKREEILKEILHTVRKMETRTAKMEARAERNER